MDIQPLNPFGIEVTGFDIRVAQKSDIDRLQELLATDGVVVLRQQRATDADFVAFLKQLGPLTFTVGETPVAHAPELNIVTNVGRTRPPRSVFHTDTSYIARPPAYTALRAVALPQRGGETLFANQYWAYKTLPKTVKQQLAAAQVLHMVTGLTLDQHQERQSWHPLFRAHPISKRIAIYLSTPERCQEMSGMGDRARHYDTQRVIRLLYRHSIRSYRLYRHRWQPNDILIWDNRCTLHRADHSQVVGDRTLHRGLVMETCLAP
ncbi:MAG: TauD/TfdA family dioxygenase [Cyanobacteria bacterium P01_D01_bin.128]